jgi:MarR family transcriptional regulator, organic hydroperoxide resistance regulator
MTAAKSTRAGTNMNKKPTVLDDIPGYESWLSVARTSQLFQRHLTAALEPHGLEIAHYDVLANVARDEGLSQQVLARRLLVAKSNVSALLSVLERKSLIARVKPVGDARVRLVSLTTEGRRITLQAMAAHARIVTKIMTAISAEEQAITQRVMVKITMALQLEQSVRPQASAAQPGV